jgi:hypothetical protein
MALDPILHGGRPARTYLTVQLEQEAARLGCRLRYYVDYDEGEGLDTTPIFAANYFAAWAQARRSDGQFYHGWPRKLLGVHPDWDAVIFPNGGLMTRDEFEAQFLVMGYVLVPPCARLAPSPPRQRRRR